MSVDLLGIATGTLALAAAMVAGVFLSFSDFVMRGLARAAPAGGMESMQQLNRTVYRSVFLTTFMLMVPAICALALARAFDGLVLAAAAVYLVGVFGVTAGANVPMNRRLDVVDPHSDEGARYWRQYVRDWTRWNHVRTAASMAVAILLVMAG